MLFLKKLTDEEKSKIIVEEKDKLHKKIQDTYFKYSESFELKRLCEDITSVPNCVSIELEHPSFVKVYYANNEKIEYKMLDYKDYGMSSLSTVEHPIQCLAFIKIIAENLNKEGFEFFLNDEDRYNAYICNTSFDLFFDEYLEKTFEKCVIQTKPQIYCSYQLFSFDVLALRNRELLQTKKW